MDDAGIVDEQRLDGLRALGDDFVAEIVGVFLDTAPPHVAAITQAYAEGDAAEVRKHAHALRGGAAGLGFIGIAAACEAAETHARGGDLLPDGDATVRHEWERLLPTALRLAGQAPA